MNNRFLPFLANLPATSFLLTPEWLTTQFNVTQLCCTSCSSFIWRFSTTTESNFTDCSLSMTAQLAVWNPLTDGDISFWCTWKYQCGYRFADWTFAFASDYTSKCIEGIPRLVSMIAVNIENMTTMMTKQAVLYNLLNSFAAWFRLTYSQ